MKLINKLHSRYQMSSAVVKLLSVQRRTDGWSDFNTLFVGLGSRLNRKHLLRIKPSCCSDVYLPGCWDFDPLCERRHYIYQVPRTQPVHWTTAVAAEHRSRTAGEVHSRTAPSCRSPWTPATESKLMWWQRIDSLPLLGTESPPVDSTYFYSGRKRFTPTEMLHSFSQ